jgi:amino acid transporter
MEHPQQQPAMKKFGTFGGVFTPTLLTILGVIMYLRLGWVVGNAGLLGAWLIILISYGITICTALSMSSIVTNIKIGAGGAYAIISQSLGLEVSDSFGLGPPHKYSRFFWFLGPCRYWRCCANANTAPGFRLLSLPSIPCPWLLRTPRSRLRLAH